MKKLLSFVMSAVLLLGAAAPALADGTAASTVAEAIALEALAALPQTMTNTTVIDIGGADAVAYNAEKYGYTEVSMESATDGSWNGDYWYPASWGKGSIAVVPKSASEPKEWAVPVTVDAAGKYIIAVSILNWDKTLANPDKSARIIDVTVDGKTYRIAESAAIAQGESAYFAVNADLAEGLNEVIFTTRTANSAQCYLQDLYFCEKGPDIVTPSALTALPADMASAARIAVTDASVIEYNETKYGRVEDTDYMFSAYVWAGEPILTTANTWAVPVTIENDGVYKLAFSIRNMYSKSPRMVNVRVGNTIYHIEEDPAVGAGVTLYYTADVELTAGTHEISFMRCGSDAYLKDLYIADGADGGDTPSAPVTPQAPQAPENVTPLDVQSSLPAAFAGGTKIDLSDEAILQHNIDKYGYVEAERATSEGGQFWRPTWMPAWMNDAIAMMPESKDTPVYWSVPVNVDAAGTYEIAVSIVNWSQNSTASPDEKARSLVMQIGEEAYFLAESASLDKAVAAYFTVKANLAAGENEILFYTCTQNGLQAYLLDLYVADGSGNAGGDGGNSGSAVIATDPIPDNVTELTASGKLPDSLAKAGVIDIGGPAVIEYNEQKFGYKVAEDPGNPDFSKTDYWIPNWAPDVIAVIPTSSITAKKWVMPIEVKTAGTYEFAVSIFNHSKHQGNADDEKAKPRQIDVTVGGTTYRLSESGMLTQNTEAFFTFTATLAAGTNEIVFSTCSANGLQAYLLDLYTTAVKKDEVDDGINRPDPLTALTFEFAGCETIDLGSQDIIDYNVNKYGYRPAEDPSNPDFTRTDYWIPVWASDVIAMIPKSAKEPVVWSVPIEIEDSGTYGFAVSIYNWNRTAVTPTDIARKIEVTIDGATYRLEESADIERGVPVYFVMYADLTPGSYEIDISTCTQNSQQCYLLDLAYTMMGTDDPYDPAIESTWPDTDEDPDETDAPETDAPETDAPETDAPETDVPETDAPDTDAPETGDTDAPKDGGSTTVIVIVAVAAVAVIAAVIAVVLKKKKK